MTTWTIDSTTLMILVMISAGVGFFVGLATNLFRVGGRKGKPPKKGLVEAGQLWRDQTSGQLWVETGGQAGKAIEDFKGDMQDRVFKIAHDLADWTGRPLAPPAVTRPVPTAAPLEIDDKPAATRPPYEAMPQNTLSRPLAVDEVSTQLPVNQPSSQIERPRIDIVKGIRLTLEGDLGRSQNPASIAAQVDEILQDKLKGTSLEKRGIRLMELPGKGMVVMVGMEQFDAVEAVPYPEIKALLKEAVATWEKKMLG